MRIYDIAFYFASFFLIGVLLYSLELSFLIIVIIAALAAIFTLLLWYLNPLTLIGYSRAIWFTGLLFIIILGAWYVSFYASMQNQKINITFDKKISFSGVVVAYPDRGLTQNLVVRLQSPYAGSILVKLPPYPSFDYGDLIQLTGMIQLPQPQAYANYLKKEHIFGVSASPQAELISKNNGSPTRVALFRLKEAVIGTFQKILPEEKAAFLAGLTLGEQAEFSKELKDAMKASGTTHLVALSGYNISIIAITIGFLFGKLFGKKWSFILSIVIITLFVLMTGAEASAVRAAIMGILLLVANQAGRMYSMRNAIVLAAFFMVLVNPLILRFDIGFELSFLALMGIVYVAPAVRKLLRVRDDPGFLALRKTFFETLGAQLAVIPFLIITFGTFSLISLLTNILVLAFIPLTMALGFITAGIGFISLSLAMIFGWLVHLLLSYELFIIKAFGQIHLLTITGMSMTLAFAYYAVLIILIVWYRVRKPAFQYYEN